MTTIPMAESTKPCCLKPDREKRIVAANDIAKRQKSP